MHWPGNRAFAIEDLVALTRPEQQATLAGLFVADGRQHGALWRGLADLNAQVLWPAGVPLHAGEQQAFAVAVGQARLIQAFQGSDQWQIPGDLFGFHVQPGR
ncbi:hypothetical protein D3C73_1514380 [compost metagenome]